MKRYIYVLSIFYFMEINVQAAAAAGMSVAGGGDAALDWIHPGTSPAVRAKVISSLTERLKLVSAKPATEVSDSIEVPRPGRSCQYDRSFEVSLRQAAKVFREASTDSIKVADIGCGFGYFTLLLPFVADDSKTMTIAAVDGVEDNIDTLKGHVRKSLSYLPSKVEFKFMSKLIQNLPDTNYFGPKAFGTFDAIFCLNVLHCMSVPAKQKALEHMHALLKPGGIIVVSHNFSLTTLTPFLAWPKEGGLCLLRQPIIYARLLSSAQEGDVDEITTAVPEELKACSQQDYIMKSEGIYQIVNRDEMKNVIIEKARRSEMSGGGESQVKLLDSYKVNEIITQEALEKKVRGAGFEMELAGEHIFNEPANTDFGKLIGAKLPYASSRAFYAVGKKPLT